jgi:NADH:ubiquinone oxidoreductase subunit 5 (subunit L)/multisubunit Na+/H+ antiporter MnhA subunit
MLQSKPWWESIRAWGLLVTLAATLAQFMGWTISVATQTQAIQGMTDIANALAQKDWVTVISGLGGLLGLVVTWVGSKQAQQPIHIFTQFEVPIDPHTVTGAPVVPITPPQSKMGA